MTATNDLFNNLIQNNPIVFDESLKNFKNIRKKDEAWVKIAEQRMTGNYTFCCNRNLLLVTES